MKRILILGLVFVSLNVQSQEASVEKSIYGVQLGLLNLSFQNEARLDRKIALRTEIGAELGFASRETLETKQSTAVITPYITAEPRWYYGIDRRTRKGKNIKNNSSNYFSLKNTYVSSGILLKNINFSYVPAVLIIPEFGIRRNFAKHFNYEFSFGIGYQYNIFSNNIGCTCSHDKATTDIQARIGYNF